MVKKSWPHVIAALLTWAFLIQCAAWIALSLGFTIRSAIFEHRSLLTSGTITEFVRMPVGDSYVALCPRFRFLTGDGTPHLHTSNACSSLPGFEVGQVVPVRYVEGDPGSARIATFWQTWGLAAGFGIAAVVVCGVGFFGLMYARKRSWTMNLLSS